jgi:hypothetical protein
MIIENPLLAIFRHYDEWNRKNQEQKKPPHPLLRKEGGGTDDFHVSWAAESAMAYLFVSWRLPKEFNVPNAS